MKTIYISIFITFSTFINAFSQDCKAKDCIIPVTSGCENFCKERVVKYSDKSELKDFGYPKEKIDEIYEYRELNKEYKEYNMERVDKCYDKIFKDNSNEKDKIEKERPEKDDRL